MDCEKGRETLIILFLDNVNDFSFHLHIFHYVYIIVIFLISKFSS